MARVVAYAECRPDTLLNREVSPCPSNSCVSISRISFLPKWTNSCIPLVISHWRVGAGGSVSFSTQTHDPL